MTELRDPDRQCRNAFGAGKYTYATKTEAKRAARRSEQLLGRMCAYRCPHCDSYHIGHKPRGAAGAGARAGA